MFCKFQADVTETIADVLQDLYRSHKDITAQVNQSECFASSQQNSKPIRQCFSSSTQASQRQSPMYCKILRDVTKTIVACFARPLWKSQRQSAMYCKIFIEVTKTIATSQPMKVFCQPLNGSHEVITTRYAMQVRNTYTLHRCFKQLGNKLIFSEPWQ